MLSRKRPAFSRRHPRALAQEGGAALDHAPLLVRGQLREQRQRQHAPAGLLADGEVALGVTQVSEALLAVQGDGVVDLAADALGLQVLDQAVALAAADPDD